MDNCLICGLKKEEVFLLIEGLNGSVCDKCVFIAAKKLMADKIEKDESEFKLLYDFSSSDFYWIKTK